MSEISYQTVQPLTACASVVDMRPTDADKQFSVDYTLLAQGRYKEWFYEGMDEAGKIYLQQPARMPEAPKADNHLINFESSQVKGWQRKAACAGADPGVFFVEEGQDPKRAYAKPDAKWRQFCPQCPVRESCLEAARESKSVGIWGGKVFAHPQNKSGSINFIREYDDTNLPRRGRPRKQSWEEMQREINDRISDAAARESLVAE